MVERIGYPESILNDTELDRMYEQVIFVCEYSTVFPQMLTVAVDRPCFRGAAIFYVLPVLWMPICFHITAPRHVKCIILKRREKMTSITAEIPTKFCSTIKTGSTYCDLRTRAMFAIRLPCL